MAYTKTNWVNGETALSQDNMNKIEQGIYDAHDALNNCYTKSDFVVLTYSKSMSGRQDYTEYVEDISDVVDDVDNYAIMGVSAKIAGTSTADEINKWVNYYSLDTVSNGYITDHKQMPTVKLYNDGDERKIKFGLICMSNIPATATIRIVLLKVA